MTANAKKINGYYLVTLQLSSISQNYSFTGTKRDARLGVSTAFLASSRCLNVPILTGTPTVKYLTTNEINIKKIRLRTTGAEFLRNGLYFSGIMAGNIELFQNFGGVYGSNSLNIRVQSYNEWEDFNYKYRPFEGMTPDPLTETFSFECGPNTEIAFDDYNIQSAYIGKGFDLTLDMYIDTAGIYSTYLHEVV